jgi:hypothetical protein
VAELHILDALGHEQCHGAGRPSGLAPAAKNRQPGGNFEATLKPYDALYISAVLGTERRLDVATDLIQRCRELFDVRITEVRVLSYFGDGNGESHPNRAVG